MKGRKNRAGLRSPVTLSGKEQVSVDEGLVSTATARTLVSSDIAEKLGVEHGPRKCVNAPWAGSRFCGPTVDVDVAVADCAATKVKAVIAKLPPGVDVVVGQDVLQRGKPEINFGRKPAMACPREVRDVGAVATGNPSASPPPASGATGGDEP